MIQNFHIRGDEKWLPKNRGTNLFKMIEMSYTSTHYGSQINLTALNTIQQCLRNLTFNHFLALINVAYLFIV